MAFADIETRLNSAVTKHLANCTATLNGGAAFSGTFEAEYIEPLGMSGSQPSLECEDAAVSAAAGGSAVVVTYKSVATSYTVGSIKPDGAGMTRLLLQEV